MTLKIEQDHSRFKKIVKGKIRKEFKKFISKGEMIGKKGKDFISIPIPQIDIPRFKFDFEQQQGVGQGDGEEGQIIGKEQGEGDGPGKAGDQPGNHVLEVDVTLEELAQILAEELELPNIQPKGKKNIKEKKDKYKSIRNVGPESLRHFKRTYKEAMKRQISTGTYDVDDPTIIPIRQDMRYKSWKTESNPEAAAVIFYMMDVSGSMSDAQKEIVRIEAFWIDTWLRSQYQDLEVRYIIHDSDAKEVDKETFFHTRESGGTKISSAYKLCLNIIQEEYDIEEWNIYPFHFSDGDNWSVDDDDRCINILKDELIPISNMFCYGQVHGIYGYGEFLKVLTEAFSEEEKLITTEIPDKDAIYESIKVFLGKGK